MHLWEMHNEKATALKHTHTQAQAEPYTHSHTHGNTSARLIKRS